MADERRQVAVLLIMETADPAFRPENRSVRTAAAAARMRRAVVRNLPMNLERVVAVLDPEMARLMCAAHEAAMVAAGLEVEITRPPADYVPPTRE